VKRSAAATPRRRPGTAMFLVVLFGLTLGALGHVAVQAQKNEIAAQLGREQAIHEELLSERRHRQIEIGRLRNPGRLVELARGRLGMTPQPAGFRSGAPERPKEATTPPATFKRNAGKEAP
jgi:hypothetical protein